jgi:hypothetical protein
MSLFEQLAHLVVGTVRDAEKGDDIDSFLAVEHFEELLVHESLSVKKTRVTLNLGRPFDLDLGAVFKHLAAHIGNSLATVFLQLDE